MDNDFDLTQLPPPGTKRWVARRKAVVVLAVRTGLISLQEVCHSITYRARNFSRGSAPLIGMAFRGFGLRDYRSTVIQTRRVLRNKSVPSAPSKGVHSSYIKLSNIKGFHR